MAQTPRERTPHASLRHFFGAELRHWRELAGLSHDRLGAQVNYSGAAICKVEKAERAPTAALAKACDQVLGTGGALARLVALIEATAQDARTSRSADAGSDPGLVHGRATWQAFHQAGTLLDSTQHDEDPPWLSFWDEADLATCEVRAALHLGEFATAERSSRTALATVREVSSSRIHAHIGQVGAELARYSDQPTVAEFLDASAEILPRVHPGTRPGVGP